MKVDHWDLVEITMSDGSKKQGVVQATYSGNGFLIYHPLHGKMCWGVNEHESDLKVQGATIRTIDDTEADFRLDLYRPKIGTLDNFKTLGENNATEVGFSMKIKTVLKILETSFIQPMAVFSLWIGLIAYFYIVDFWPEYTLIDIDIFLKTILNATKWWGLICLPVASLLSVKKDIRYVSAQLYFSFMVAATILLSGEFTNGVPPVSKIIITTLAIFIYSIILTIAIWIAEKLYNKIRRLIKQKP